jgi:hypothetical protein
MSHVSSEKHCTVRGRGEERIDIGGIGPAVILDVNGIGNSCSDYRGRRVRDHLNT